jgi:glycosyltransferase involved in cell wall biosynthesis
MPEPQERQPAGTGSISVCICTFNRAAVLERTLRQLATVHIPSGVEFEVVVVDNGSTDATQVVLQQLRGGLPLRPVREARLGLSHARNAAAKAARGDVLLWTDDDVLVEPGWVEGYVRACTDFPDAGFYGGPVDPWFEGEPPGWLRECFRSLGQAYAIRDLPPGTTDLSRGSLPYGANFATRTELHSRLSFDPDLGRVGRRGGCLSEESSFLQRALDLGYSGRWVPESRVAHLIPRERQTLRYLREYFVIAGSTPTNPGLGGPTLLGRPRWLWRSLVENELKFWATRWLTGPGTWMPYLRDAAIARGALRRKG